MPETHPEFVESTENLTFVENPEERFSTGLVLERDIEREDRLAAVRRLVHFEDMEEIVGAESPYGKAFYDLDAYQGDQNGYGSCTGGAARNLINCAPIKHNYPESLMYRLYDIASRSDPWPGYFDSTTMTQYGDGGSSMQAIARALVSEGYAVTFAITYDVDTMCAWLANDHGPGLLGMPWGGCFRVDEKGYVHPDNTDGGHATMVRSLVRTLDGDQVGPDRIRGTNQWGRWGLDGDYRMTLEELARVDFTFVAIAEVKRVSGV